MSLSINTQYPTQSAAPDADYPFGSARNITVPSDGTGTPLEEAWFNDYVGFFSSLLNEVGETPSGNPDTVLVPQYLNALRKGRALVDARAFGATGDGATNDTVALQAAIDYVNGLSGGGCVAIISGVYVTDLLTLPSNVHLFGAGGTLELSDNADTSLLQIPVGSDRITIEGLTLDGNSANNVGTPAGIGLIHLLSTNVAPTTNVTIRSCTINDAYDNAVTLEDGVEHFNFLFNTIDGSVVGHGVFAGAFSPADVLIDVRIIGNRITGCDGSAIRADGEVLGFIITGNFLDGTGSGGSDTLLRVRVGGASRQLVVTGNTIQNAGLHAVLLGALDLIFSNNNVINWGAGTGLLINTGGLGIVENAVVSGNTFIGDGVTVDGMAMTEIANISVVGNSVDDCISGIEVGASRASIQGNTVRDHTSQGILITSTGAPGGIVLGWAVNGNTVIGQGPGSTTEGIRISGGEQCACNGNSITDCATGILEANATNWNTVVGNCARGNTTPITIIGANSISANNVV